MIRVMPESDGKILGIEAQDTLTHGDYKEILIPRMESIIEEFGKIRLLINVPNSVAHWTPEAMWDDIRFGRAHKDEIEKMCLVGDANMFQWSLKIYSELATDHAMNFSREQLEEAWAWIRS